MLGNNPCAVEDRIFDLGHGDVWIGLRHYQFIIL
jgi:hypothetical protein